MHSLTLNSTESLIRTGQNEFELMKTMTVAAGELGPQSRDGSWGTENPGTNNQMKRKMSRGTQAEGRKRAEEI